MGKVVAALVLAVGLFWNSAVSAAGPVEVQWWHSLSPESRNGEILIRLTEESNASQSKYKVVPSYKGTAYDAINAAIAAYRAKKHPAILQVIQTSSITLMESGAIYPVQDLMSDNKAEIDWSRFIKPILDFYRDKNGKLLSMPFNTSTPIFWYNADAFAKAGIKTVPETWDEVGDTARKLRAAGYECGFTTAWLVWVNLDNYSFTNNQPIATQGNGMKGYDAQFAFNKTRFKDHVGRLSNWVKEGIFTYTGRTWQGANEAFFAQKCPMYTESSAAYGGIEKNAAGKFRFGAGPLPVEKDSPRLNSAIGGSSNYILKGFSKAEYEAVAAFLKFLSSPEKQLDWHKSTGYVPTSIDAYELGKKEGYYEKFPHQEVAIKQLMRGTPSENSAGIRLGDYSQVSTVIEEELENIWAGKQGVDAGLDNAVRRGNEILRRFEKTVK